MNKRQNILIGVLAGAVIVILILTIFSVGVLAGQRQQEKRFWPFWEKRHTYRNFIPEKLNGHGVFGQIESLGDKSMVVEEKDGALKTILWDDQTRFVKNHDKLTTDELVEGETVVIVGNPSEQEDAVVARIIRVIGRRLPTSSPSPLPQKEL